MIRAVAFSHVKLGRWEIRQFVRYFEWSKAEGAADSGGARARICKRLRSPGIDSKVLISPAYVAWRAGTSNRVVVPARQAGNRFLGSLKGRQHKREFSGLENFVSQCCGSVFIHIMWILIFPVHPDPDPDFWWPNHEKISLLIFFFNF
jgi:hypothetical protein